MPATFSYFDPRTWQILGVGSKPPQAGNERETQPGQLPKSINLRWLLSCEFAFAQHLVFAEQRGRIADAKAGSALWKSLSRVLPLVEEIFKLQVSVRDLMRMHVGDLGSISACKESDLRRRDSSRFQHLMAGVGSDLLRGQ